MSFSISGRNNLEEVCCTRSQTHCLLEYANSNRQLELFNDFVINAGKQSIPANKLVLSCFSLYFENMFKTEMKEKHDNCVEIENIEGNLMRNLVDFIYTGSININGDNVCDLLSASDYLVIEDVKQFCFNFLSRAINVENCFIIYALACSCGNNSLANQACQFIGVNMDAVISSDDFKNVSKDFLVSFVSNQDKILLQNESIFRAVVSWVKHDKVVRENFLPELLQMINFFELSCEFFVDVVLKESLLMENLSFTKAILETIPKYLKTKEVENSERRILCFCDGNAKVAEVFNIGNLAKLVYPNLPEERQAGCCLKLNDFVYYLGGKIQGQSTNTVWKMNLKAKKRSWEKFPPMSCNRHSMGAAIFNESLVVVGGLENIPISILSEYYSSMSKKWTKLSFMEYRFNHSLVSCKGCLYAIGGQNKNTTSLFGQIRSSVVSSTVVSSVVVFSGDWKNIQPLQIQRSLLAAVNCNDVIYAIGGQSSLNVGTALKSAEKYDITNNEWTYISDMNFERKGCAACVLQGKIFVVGGLDANEQFVMEIEHYDPLTNKWTVVGRTEEELNGHSLVVV